MPGGATSTAKRREPGRLPLNRRLRLLVGGAVAALVVATAALPARAATTTVLPRRADIASLTAKVADAYRGGRPCGTTGCAITNKWDDAVLMVGMVEHWRSFRRTQDRTYAANWANANGWRLFSDLSGDQRNPNWHNRMTAGYAYLRLLEAGVPGASIADVRANLDAQLALRLTPEREQLVDYVFPGQTVSSFSWKAVDAEYLALPTWILMGKRTGRTAYLDRARDLQNYQVEVMGLRDPETGLWFRDEATKSLRSPNGEKIVWGRGAGWIAAALASALTELPATRPEYALYRTRFVELMDAARTRQRPDGFWNMNLEDSRHYPAPETSGTALITYAMARGVRLGVLDRQVYEPVAARAWNAMAATSVRRDGRLGFVQGIGSAPIPPSDRNFPDETSDIDPNFGVGAFLLAGTAIHEIAAVAGPRRVRLLEAEALATTVSAGDRQSDVSNVFASGGRSNAAVLNAPGDFVEYRATDAPVGTYGLRVRFRLAPDHGLWQLRLNGANVGAPVDAYDPVAHFAEADLGAVIFGASGGARRFRFVVAGRNAGSSGYRIGIDAISYYALAAGTAGVPAPAGAAGPVALAPAAGGPAVVAPVPVPASALGLLGALSLLGLVRRSRRRAAPA